MALSTRQRAVLPADRLPDRSKRVVVARIEKCVQLGKSEVAQRDQRAFSGGARGLAVASPSWPEVTGPLEVNLHTFLKVRGIRRCHTHAPALVGFAQLRALERTRWEEEALGSPHSKEGAFNAVCHVVPGKGPSAGESVGHCAVD